MLTILFPLLAGLAGIALALVTLRRLNPQNLVGDEVEYGGASASRNHALWIRVPLHRACLQAASAVLPGHGQLGARLFTSVVSGCTIGIATYYAQIKWGGWAAFIPAVILLASVERAVLSIHLWPDVSMGLYWLLAGILVTSEHSYSIAALAVVGGLAVGTRIEGLALCFVALAFAIRHDGLFGAVLTVAICGGFMSVYLAWNRLRHGVWRLDTTTGFNLTVLRLDAAEPANSIANTMQSAVAQTTKNSVPPPASSVSNHLSRLAVRARALTGPDRFVSQALIRSGAAGYRAGFALRDHGFMAINLRYWSSLAFLLCLIGLPMVSVERVALLGLAILVYLALLVRTRFRMAVLPLISLCIAEAAHGLVTQQVTWSLLVGPMLAGVLIFILRRAPALHETNP